MIDVEKRIKEINGYEGISPREKGYLLVALARGLAAERDAFRKIALNIHSIVEIHKAENQNMNVKDLREKLIAFIDDEAAAVMEGKHV